MKAKFKFNLPQLRSILNPADIHVDILPRGTGKSTLLGYRLQQLAYEMPRAMHTILGRTYTQLMTKTLPSSLAALEELNYYEGIHYKFGKPFNFNGYNGPLQKIQDYSNCIVWHNGAIFPLVSQDRPGMARGMNSDSLTADEGLTLKRRHLEEEIFPTIRANVRANESVFKGQTKLHHSKHIVSTKPISTEGMWLLDYGKYYDEAGLNYSKLHRLMVDLQLKFIDEPDTARQVKIWKELLAVKRQIAYYTYRDQNGDTTFYQEASIFDNIENLGYKYIRDQRRTLTELVFLVEILNLTIDKVEDGFYPAFIEQIHCYDQFNYNYLDKFQTLKEFRDKVNTWEADADYICTEPMVISCDYNHSINSMVVGQMNYGGTLKVVNAFHVLKPQLLKDNAQLFIDYYSGTKNKDVFFFYAQDAIDNTASRKSTFPQEYSDYLTKAGFKVKLIYMGQAWSNHHSYKQVNNFLQARNHVGAPFVTFNRERCKHLIRSIQLAPVKQGDKGFKKDKSSETKKIPQEDATHYSEAFDRLIQGITDHWQSARSFNFPFMAS